MTRELVSVVMPAHNAARWVEQAVTSMLVQTHRELEVIVVDDASTDRTPDIVSAFRDSRVRLVQKMHNGGCGRALNTGLEHAQGVIIARLDADDYALPQRLERQVQMLARAPDIGVLDAAAWRVDASGRSLGRSPRFEGRALHYQLLQECPIVHPAVVMRKSVLPRDGYPSVDTQMEDYALWLELAPQVRLEHLPEPLIVYRRHPGAIGAQRTGLRSQAEWARIMARQLGLAIDTQVAAAWLHPSHVGHVSESCVAQLVSLVRRLDPETFTFGAHVPAWTPLGRARASRLYAHRVVRLVLAARAGGRRDVVAALVGDAAKLSARAIALTLRVSRRGSRRG